MASLDSLPADQRAVLQLVLQRDRTYDEIAAMLSIDRAGVRQRALSALDALGPQTGVSAERRALITDYLLGQLPARVSETTRERLGESASERAWARVVASELSGLATSPLPEIPVESTRREQRPEPTRRSARREPSIVAAAEATPDADATPEVPPRQRAEPSDGRRSSLRGGAVLIGVAVVALVVAVILIAGGGGSSKHTSSSTVASTPTTAAATTTPATTTGTGSTTAPQVVRQINLTSPGSPQSKATGLADVLKQGATNGIAIVAQNVTPNTKHDAYAVWLYNSPSDSHILGYVNPGVGSNGRLSTAGALPTNASHYKQLIVTLETQSNPKTPGQVILQGQLTLS